LLGLGIDQADVGKGLQSGEVRIVLQTIEKSHPDLKNVPLAIQYAKSDEARALLGIANGPYAQGARPYTVPPGLPQDRLQLLQRPSWKRCAILISGGSEKSRWTSIQLMAPP
jgi:hypothetical protein